MAEFDFVSYLACLFVKFNNITNAHVVGFRRVP